MLRNRETLERFTVRAAVLQLPLPLLAHAGVVPFWIARIVALSLFALALYLHVTRPPRGGWGRRVTAGRVAG